jgi:hypothetical protein
MTGYFVNSFVEESTGGAAFELTGAGDTLLVTSAGSLVALGGGDGIDAIGNSETITLDGLAYGGGSFGAGVYLGGQDCSLLVNGHAESATYFGIDLANLRDSVNIGGQGEVSGLYGIFTGAADGTITNDGHVTGTQDGIFLDGATGDQITNDGTISASQSGSFDGAFVISGATSDTISNTGVISAPNAFYVATGSTATIENSGTIEGNVVVADTSQIDLENAGVVQATSLDFLSSANNVLTNSGRIHAQIDMGTGIDQIYNTGTITGQIDFAGSSDTLINDGTIHGSVTLGVNDQVINTGTIRGPVFLGAGDTLNTTGGAIIGSIGAANKDTFDFGGSFGHNTIGGFLGGGSLHDTIHFASDDFANYAAVQAHMAQVGANFVITLDPADTIILQHITLAHLYAADFTFG